MKVEQVEVKVKQGLVSAVARVCACCSLCELHSLCPCCCCPPVPPIPQPPQVREAALCVDHAVRLPWLRVGFVHPQGSCPGWACKPRFTVGDLGPCVWLCVCVLARLSCVSWALPPVVPPSDPSAPSLQLVGPLAGAGEQGLRCTVCRLPPAQVLAVCGGAGQEIAVSPLPPPPMSCAFPR